MDDPAGGDQRSATAFEHIWVPGADEGAPVLVLLHGSNGGERDLLAPAAAMLPGAARLGVRGGVVMDPGHAFFHRFPDRTIDEADLRSRVPGLVRSIQRAVARHRSRVRPLLVGYSNGAIVAAATALTEPQRFAGAILLRPASLHRRVDPGAPVSFGPDRGRRG